MRGLIRSRWFLFGVTLLAASIAARLGFWQLDRAAVKTQLQASTLQRAAEPPLLQAALARDAGLLVNPAGYRCTAAGMVNMFPHTAHVESMAVFDRE